MFWGDFFCVAHPMHSAISRTAHFLVVNRAWCTGPPWNACRAAAAGGAGWRGAARGQTGGRQPHPACLPARSARLPLRQPQPSSASSPAKWQRTGAGQRAGRQGWVLSCSGSRGGGQCSNVCPGGLHAPHAPVSGAAAGALCLLCTAERWEQGWCAGNAGAAKESQWRRGCGCAGVWWKPA